MEGIAAFSFLKIFYYNFFFNGALDCPNVCVRVRTRVCVLEVCECV